MTSMVIAYDCARHGWTQRQVIEMLGTAPGTLMAIRDGFAAARDPVAFWGREDAPPPCVETNRARARERRRRLREDPAYRAADNARMAERARLRRARKEVQ